MISWGADHMIARCAIVIVMLLAFRPAVAESLNGDAARRFVVGKLFAFNCFDGSRGAGRIYGDGSVVGTIQFQGLGPVESVWLPSGTLKVKGEAVCASLNRLRLSHVSISIGPMTKASAVRFQVWISPIATSLAA
jgi:hypothetical protein